MLPCKPLSTFRDICSEEMPGNSTHQSRWDHPVSLSALGSERNSFLRCGPKMPLPEQDMLLCTSWFSICCRSLMGNGTLFFSGLTRKGDQKFGCALETNLSAFLVCQQKCNRTPPYCILSDFYCLLLLYNIHKQLKAATLVQYLRYKTSLRSIPLIRTCL